MSTVLVVHVCDVCGARAEQSLQETPHPSLAPRGWLKVEERGGSLAGTTCCSWGCVEELASAKLGAEE